MGNIGRQQGSLLHRWGIRMSRLSRSRAALPNPPQNDSSPRPESLTVTGVAPKPPGSSKPDQPRANVQPQKSHDITNDTVGATLSTALRSAAYDEAVLSLDGEEQESIKTGKSIEVMLKELDQSNEEKANESLFRKGARKLKKPLENFQVGLDLLEPFAVEPHLGLAVGIVRGVAAVSFSSMRYEESGRIEDDKVVSLVSPYVEQKMLSVSESQLC